MTASYKVGPKGQVVVAKQIRDKLGVEPGWIAIQELVDDHLEVRFLPPEHNESLAGSLAPYIKRRLGDRDWNQVREEAWAAAVRERMADRDI
jgi:bifunctional DNA-binding transcriptional regulator/antitoxin component of YhaV-PrlF toxin-antitoxin module